MQRRGTRQGWLLIALAGVAIGLLAAHVASAAVTASPHGALHSSAAPATPDGLRTGAQIADAVRNDSVYADPRAKPTLTAAERAALNAEIEQRDPTRIKIAITTPGVARRAGSLQKLADEIDQALGGPGVVVVIAGGDAWLVTVYDNTDAAVAAARRTLNDQGTLAAQLRNLIVGLAAVDPDRGRPHEPKPKPARGSSGQSGSTKTRKDDAGAVIVGLIVLAVIFGGPIWLAVWRYRRRRRRSPTHTSAAGFSADMAQKTANLTSTESVDQANKAFGGDD